MHSTMAIGTQPGVIKLTDTTHVRHPADPGISFGKLFRRGYVEQHVSERSLLKI